MSEHNKRNQLSLETKMKIIHEVDKAEKSKSLIAKDFNIPLSTLSTVLKNREKFEVVSDSLKGRKRVRTPRHEELEESLKEWYNQMQSENLPISGRIVKEQADLIANKLGIYGFKCNDSWVKRFWDRNNLKGSKEKDSLPKFDDAEKVALPFESECWSDSLQDLIQAYALQDLFSMSEACIFYNSIPNALEIKESQDKVVVLLCCNANGSEKLRPLVIGKLLKPTCLEGLPKNKLPCDYEANAQTVLNLRIFQKWLRNLDKEMASQNRNILILLHRYTKHLAYDLTLNNIKLIYLPSKNTNFLLPMHQGIISNLKERYKIRLVKHLVGQLENNLVPRKWNVLDAIRTITFAWENIPPPFIFNCFKNSLFWGDGNIDEQVQSGLVDISDVWEKLQNLTEYKGSWLDFVEAEGEVLTVAPNVKTSLEGPICEDEVTEKPVMPAKKAAMEAISVLDNVVAACAPADNETISTFYKLCDFVYTAYKPKPKFVQLKIENFFKPS